MGFLDKLIGAEPEVLVASPLSEEYLQRAADLDAVSDVITAAIASRQSAMSMTEALKLPAVQRGATLIASIGASFAPLAYGKGSPVLEQPRICRRPNPFKTRYDHLYETIWSLIEDGNAYWKVIEGGRSAICLDPDDVNVTWDDRRFLGHYEWRGQRLKTGEFIHIAINRRPGELEGRSPLSEGLDYLANVKAAEEYALGFFDSGGVPEVVLKAMSKLTASEASAIKSQWVNSRTSGTPEPAVLGEGMSAEFPAIDPQRAQMQEARAYGATIVARLLGIPAPLLHVETSGATITYQNAIAAVSELVKGTIVPMYLRPIEEAWSDLVPGTQSVRFDLAEMTRTDIAGRMDIYQKAISSGVMTAEEARAYEGWAATTEAGHQFDPIPLPKPDTEVEVPVG